MGFIYWGIVLIIVGLVFGLFGGPFVGTISNVGWLLLIVGLVLAVVHAMGGGRARSSF